MSWKALVADGHIASAVIFFGSSWWVYSAFETQNLRLSAPHLPLGSSWPSDPPRLTPDPLIRTLYAAQYDLESLSIIAFVSIVAVT